MSVRVIDLLPGDEVTLAGQTATFIVQDEHPRYPMLRLVVWRLADGSFSFDALDQRQVVGDLTATATGLRTGQRAMQERYDRLRAALSPPPGEEKG